MSNYGTTGQRGSRISRAYNRGTFIVEAPLTSGERITIELPIDVTREEDIERATRILAATAPNVVKQIGPGDGDEPATDA